MKSPADRESDFVDPSVDRRTAVGHQFDRKADTQTTEVVLA
jgi:hypothetical protein